MSTGDSQNGESPSSPSVAPASEAEPGSSSSAPPNNPSTSDTILIDASNPSGSPGVLTIDASKKPSGSLGVLTIDASKASDNAPKEVTVDIEKRRDYVRLIVTLGLLFMLFVVIVWSCIEAASWPNHWQQTKEMLQAILPALTGLIGSVIGFYFGASSKGAVDSNKSGQI